MLRASHFFLLLLVFTSALSLILIRHQMRLQSMEIRQLELQHEGLLAHWRELQLEVTTWASTDRVEKLAREKLEMREPENVEMVVLE